MMFRRWLWLAIIAMAAVGMALLAGCGGGGGSDQGGGGGTTGVVRVAITDQAAYASVVVAITDVRVVPEGDEGAETGQLPAVQHFDPPLVVNISELSYEQLLIGEATVPAGNYNQIRLVLAPNVSGQDPVNYITFADTPDEKHALDTPSGQQSGLKINGAFEIAPGLVSTVVLDFDPSRAVVSAGNSGKYLLKPTGIRLTQTIEVLPVYGALAGTIAPAAAWPLATIDVIPVGGADPVATATPDLADGSFRIPLPPGSYSLRVTAAGYETLDTATLDPPQVFDVVEAVDTAVGELTLTPTP